ncbi:MAG: PLP-dependent aminotransferase family protein [Burkholderiales bacterium]|nr:PLP-dependent aminotransferase family protein [Burkholderiales bacterium]
MDYSPEYGGIIYKVASMARQAGGISFAGGYPDPALFDTEGLAQAFNRVFRESFRVALQYGEREGHPPLRARLAAFCSTASRAVAAEEVIVVNGGQQGIETAVQVLTRRGDTVFMDSPVFPTALQAFHLAGLNGVSVPKDADGLVPEALEALLRTHRPKLFYVVPSYANPDGSVLAEGRRRRLLELAVEHRFHILEDDPYSRLWFDAPAPPSLLALSGEVPGARDWVIHVSSLSKLVAPGLRVGWMIPPPALRQECVWTKLATDIHSALPTQHAVDHYWASGAFDAHLPAIRATYGARARAMHGALVDHLGDRLAFAAPRGGMFMWCRMNRGGDARDLLEAAQREGVYFVPGIAFYPRSPDLATFRLSFATTPEDGIVEGIRRLARVIP